MKLKLMMDKLYVISEVEAEKVLKLRAYDEDALSMKDENGEVCFTWLIKPGEVGAASKFGVVFNNIDDEGHLVSILPVSGETAEDRKKNAAERYAAPINNATLLEERIKSAYGRLEHNVNDVLEKINVLL